MIGIWGAVLLTIGRILQGLAIGGQWSGSVLMARSGPIRSGAASPPASRSLARRAGMVLANGALALMTGAHLAIRRSSTGDGACRSSPASRS